MEENSHMSEEIHEETLKKRMAELELELKVATEKYKLLANYANCGLWEYDIPLKKLSQSKKLNGKWSNNRLIIENYRDTVKSWGIVHPDDIGIFEQYCDSMDRGDSSFVYELRAIGDESKYIWMRYEGSAIYNEKGIPVKIIGKTLDITREKEERALLERKAHEDALTKLYNKVYTKEKIEHVIEESGGQSKHLFIILDIDDFKNINDRWGHYYGDQVLLNFTDTIKEMLSAEDIFGRIGGDEFIILCPEIESYLEAENFVKKLLYHIRGIQLEDKKHLTSSMGVAFYPKDGISYDVLYRRADLALYQNKRSGKDNYTVFNKRLENKNALGETVRKQVDSRQLHELENGLLEKESSIINSVVEIVRAGKDYYKTIDEIYEYIGKTYKLDKVCAIERSVVNGQLSVIRSWNVHNEDSRETKLLATYSMNWNALKQHFCTSPYYIYNAGQGIQQAEGKIAHLNNDHAAILFPMMDDGKLTGVVIFEDSQNERIWESREIGTLTKVVKVLNTIILNILHPSQMENEMLYAENVMDNSKMAYYVINPDTYELLYASKYTYYLCPHLQLGSKCYEMIMGRQTPCHSCPLSGLSDQNVSMSMETYNEHFQAWLSITGVMMHKGENYKECLVCFQDVTSFMERVKAKDQLTGTLSFEKFKGESLKLIGNKTVPYAVVFLGIKHFKQINDEMGYVVGDKVLQLVGKSLSNILLTHELVCRVKGDDFLLLLADPNTEETWERVFHACMSIGILLQEKYPELKVRCIAGIYHLKEDDYSFSNSIDKANKARKKAATRFFTEEHNVVIYNEESENEVIRENLIEQNMFEALNTGQFKVYFQPKVGLKDNKISGAEALVRWVQPDGTFVPTGQFISLFEQNGFIVELDNYVYKTLFSQIRQWLDEGIKVPVISINVSRLHLFDEKFPEFMEKLMNRYQIPYEIIELEITERVFFDKADRLITMISHLREKGFAISMDDFGNGYSTLSLMKSLPIDVLKIDGSFFLDNEMDQKNTAIISSIIHLCKKLNLKVLAEGIETEEQAEYIRGEGCDYAQGYLYYKPISGAEFEKLIRSE